MEEAAIWKTLDKGVGSILAAGRRVDLGLQFGKRKQHIPLHREFERGAIWNQWCNNWSRT